MKQYIIILLILMGCVGKSNNSKTPVTSNASTETTLKETQAILKRDREMDSLMKVKQMSSDNTPSKYELETYSKMRSVTSYAKFLRSYFTLGSSKMQVLKVQGNPDDIVSTKQNTEVLFYNQCEITLINDRVSKVHNPSDCVKYIDFKICLNSSDPVVEKNITTIMYEASEAN